MSATSYTTKKMCHDDDSLLFSAENDEDFDFDEDDDDEDDDDDFNEDNDEMVRPPLWVLAIAVVPTVLALSLAFWYHPKENKRDASNNPKNY